MSDAEAGPAKLPLRKKLLFLLIMMIVIGGVAELALRIAWSPPPESMGNVRHTDLFVKVAEVGWRARPGYTVKHKLFEGHEVTVRTNSRGFRDGEHDFEKQEGTQRIVVLGDSFPFGYGVENDEIFTVYLRDLLGCEVVNMGVTGYTLAQSHKLLEIEGLDYHPDAVVVPFCMNDVTTARIPDVEHRPRRSAGASGLKRFLARHSYLYAATTRAISRSKSISRFFIKLGIKQPLAGYDGLDDNVRPALKKYPDRLAAAWKAATEELRAIAGTCRKASVPCLVAIIPCRESIERSALAARLTYVDYEESDFDMTKPYRALEAFCRDAGIPLVNPYGAFRKSGDGLYIPYDMHFSPRGHKLFAEQLAPAVRALLTGQ